MTGSPTRPYVVARRIADLRADAATQARIDELAAKANEGRLTEGEHAEYDVYRSAFHVITILQAKARALRKDNGVS